MTGSGLKGNSQQPRSLLIYNVEIGVSWSVAALAGEGWVAEPGQHQQQGDCRGAGLNTSPKLLLGERTRARPNETRIQLRASQVQQRDFHSCVQLFRLKMETCTVRQISFMHN